MGAFISLGDPGVWASNRERNCPLDWLAEYRCSAGDPRWQWCKDEAQRWSGRCLDLAEFLQADEVFQVTEEEASRAADVDGPTVAQLLKHIELISRGQWNRNAGSVEAVIWRET